MREPPNFADLILGTTKLYTRFSLSSCRWFLVIFGVIINIEKWKNECLSYNCCSYWTRGEYYRCRNILASLPRRWRTVQTKSFKIIDSFVELCNSPSRTIVVYFCGYNVVCGINVWMYYVFRSALKWSPNFRIVDWQKKRNWTTNYASRRLRWWWYVYKIRDTIL